MVDNAEFLKNKVEALSSLNRKTIETFSKRYSIRFPSDEKEFWKRVHLSIAMGSEFTPELQDQSRLWLKENGVTWI